MSKNSQQEDSKSELSFESAFERLEEILEKMNSGATSLEESLKLYEEADKLIATSHKRLTEAERKIEILIKNRQGELVIGGDQKPQTQGYNSMPNQKANPQM